MHIHSHTHSNDIPWYFHDMSWYAHFSLHRSQVGSAGSLHRGEFLVGSLRRSMVPWVELPRRFGRFPNRPVSVGSVGDQPKNQLKMLGYHQLICVLGCFWQGILILASWMGNIWWYMMADFSWCSHVFSMVFSLNFPHELSYCRWSRLMDPLSSSWNSRWRSIKNKAKIDNEW